jgi:hypothetical protein
MKSSLSTLTGQRRGKGALGIAALILLVSSLTSACAKEGSCLEGSNITVARYEDCIAECKLQNKSACSKRSELESGLSTICHTKGNPDACKVLCTGRKSDQQACKRWRELKASR